MELTDEEYDDLGTFFHKFNTVLNLSVTGPVVSAASVFGAQTCGPTDHECRSLSRQRKQLCNETFRSPNGAM